VLVGFHAEITQGEPVVLRIERVAVIDLHTVVIGEEETVVGTPFCVVLLTQLPKACTLTSDRPVSCAIAGSAARLTPKRTLANLFELIIF
jgi:hypothetical protein